MSPSEYESFIADVVRKFDCGSEAKVLRNARFPGIRQPGDYEIDLARSFNVANALDFLVIVECKNWSRPVDRPVVQKLAQTKDAIGAHKAALVSPVGFSKEAVEVASVFGIALWVLSKTSWTVIMASSGVGVGAHLAYQKRKAYLDGLPFRFTEASDGFELVSFASAHTHQVPRSAILMDSPLGTCSGENVRKETLNVHREETRFRGRARSPEGD